MADVDLTAALGKLLRPLSQELSLELAGALTRLKADPETQARYEMLANRNTEGQLTQEEHEELQSLVYGNTLLGILKAKAQMRMSHSKPR